MGYFTINLPDSRHGEVRWGKVRKLQLPFLWLSKKNRDEKTGYIITVNSAIEGITEYRLFKTKEGIWSHDPDGRNQVDDKIALAIRDAIEQREKAK